MQDCEQDTFSLYVLARVSVEELLDVHTLCVVPLGSLQKHSTGSFMPKSTFCSIKP